jgi:hypothetical protein
MNDASGRCFSLPGASPINSERTFYLPPVYPANNLNITELTTGTILDEQVYWFPDPQELTFV